MKKKERKTTHCFSGVGSTYVTMKLNPSSTNESRDNFAIFFGEGLRCGDKVNTSAVGRQKKNSTAARKLKTRYQRLDNLCERRLCRLFFDVTIFNTSVFLKRKLFTDAFKYHQNLKAPNYQQEFLGTSKQFMQFYSPYDFTGSKIQPLLKSQPNVLPNSRMILFTAGFLFLNS